MPGRMRLKKFTLLFKLMVALAWPVALGCGPFPVEDGTFNFFDHRIVGNPLFASCFQVHKGRFDSGMPGPAVPIDMRPEMEAEWRAFASQIGTVHSLAELIFSGDAARVSEVQAAAGGAALHAACDYLLYAFEVAPLVAPGDNYWRWEAPKQNDAQALALLAVASRRAADTKLDAFLRARYGFQTVRLAALMGHHQQAVEAYNKWVGPSPRCTVRYMAWGYKARALLKLGDRRRATQTYLELYDQYPPMMASALLSLRMVNPTVEEWQQIYARYRSRHKRATLVFVKTLLQSRDYSADTLRDLVGLEPASDRPEALLVRMIHTIERHNMKTDHTRFFMAKSPTNNYLALVDLCAETGAHKKTRTPALWFAAGAYLALLDGQLARSTELLAQARAAGTANLYLKHQLELLEFLALFQREPAGFSDRLKDLLWAGMQWYDRDTNPTNFNRKIAHSILFFAIHRFVRDGDGLRAALGLAAAGYETFSQRFLDMVADDAQLAALEALCGGDQHPMDAALLARFPIRTRDEAIYYRAVNHIRRESYTEALTQLERLAPDFIAARAKLTTSEANPEFQTEIEMLSFTLPRFCRLMEANLAEKDRLENLVAAGNGIPENAIQLARLNGRIGNLYYNLDRIGEPEIAKALPRRRTHPYFFAHPVPNDLWRVTDTGIKQKQQAEAFATLIDNYARAEPYYRRVVELEVDRELAAQACVLINTCRNIYLYEGMEVDKKAMEYHFVLAKKYADTQFYQDFLEQCPPAAMFR